ncbi:hypothetical protein [Leptospira borgpetersenii]|nr:hypothetical protein [Leptospira borgpetersenii]
MQLISFKVLGQMLISNPSLLSPQGSILPKSRSQNYLSKKLKAMIELAR